MRLRRFNIDESTYYLAEIAEGIESLHQNAILHRDLKPENILMTDDGHLKIGDLGLATSMIDERQKETCGTWIYSSPEMLGNHAYGYSTNWWSYGVVAQELFTQQHSIGKCFE